MKKTIPIIVLLLAQSVSAGTLRPAFPVDRPDLAAFPILVEVAPLRTSSHIALYIHSSGIMSNNPQRITVDVRNSSGETLYQGIVPQCETLSKGTITLFRFEIHKDLVETTKVEIGGIDQRSMLTPYLLDLAGLVRHCRIVPRGVNPIQKAFQKRTCNAGPLLKKVDAFYLRKPSTKVPNKPLHGTR